MRLFNIAHLIAAISSVVLSAPASNTATGVPGLYYSPSEYAVKAIAGIDKAILGFSAIREIYQELQDLDLEKLLAESKSSDSTDNATKKDVDELQKRLKLPPHDEFSVIEILSPYLKRSEAGDGLQKRLKLPPHDEFSVIEILSPYLKRSEAGDGLQKRLKLPPHDEFSVIEILSPYLKRSEASNNI